MNHFERIRQLVWLLTLGGLTLAMGLGYLATMQQKNQLTKSVKQNLEQIAENQTLKSQQLIQSVVTTTDSMIRRVATHVNDSAELAKLLAAFKLSNPNLVDLEIRHSVQSHLPNLTRSVTGKGLLSYTTKGHKLGNGKYAALKTIWLPPWPLDEYQINVPRKWILLNQHNQMVVCQPMGFEHSIEQPGHKQTPDVSAIEWAGHPDADESFWVKKMHFDGSSLFSQWHTYLVINKHSLDQYVAEQVGYNNIYLGAFFSVLLVLGAFYINQRITATNKSLKEYAQNIINNKPQSVVLNNALTHLDKQIKDQNQMLALLADSQTAFVVPAEQNTYFCDSVKKLMDMHAYWAYANNAVLTGNFTAILNEKININHLPAHHSNVLKLITHAYQQIKEMRNGKYDPLFVPKSTDNLFENELYQLSIWLKRMDLDWHTRHWVTQGHNTLIKKLASAGTHVQAANWALNHLCTYVQANSGFYLTQRDNKLYYTAFYGVKNQMALAPITIETSGLINEVFIKNQITVLNEIPVTYYQTSFDKPPSLSETLILIPLVKKDYCVGLFELKAYQVPDQKIKEYLENIRNTLANFLFSTASAEQLMELSQTLEKQNDQLMAQENQMRLVIENLKEEQKYVSDVINALKGQVKHMDALITILGLDAEGNIVYKNQNATQNFGPERKSFADLCDDLCEKALSIVDEKKYWQGWIKFKLIHDRNTHKQTAITLCSENTQLSPKMLENSKIKYAVYIATNLSFIENRKTS